MLDIRVAALGFVGYGREVVENGSDSSGSIRSWLGSLRQPRVALSMSNYGFPAKLSWWRWRRELDRKRPGVGAIAGGVRPVGVCGEGNRSLMVFGISRTVVFFQA